MIYWIGAFVILLAGLGVSLFIDMRNKGKGVRDYKGISGMFNAYAETLYSLWSKVWPDWYRVEDYLEGGEITGELELLNPGKKRRDLFLAHMRGKVAAALMIITAVTLIGSLVCFSDLLGSNLEEGRIRRNDYGGGEKQVSLIAEYEGKKEKMDVRIGEKEYDRETMEGIMAGEMPGVFETFLGDNPGFTAISSNVNPVDTCFNGLIEVTWRFSDYEVIDGDGNLHEDRLRDILEESGEKSYPISITAILQYKDVRKEETKEGYVVLGGGTKEEQLEAELRSSLRRNEEAGRTQDYYSLPASAAGVDVTWSEPAPGGHIGLLLVGIGAAVVIIFLKDRDVKEKAAVRSKDLEYDYPELVVKLNLMIGAGISLGNAWERITGGYVRSLSAGGRKRFLYEEMLITLHEMQRGDGEISALQRFGERCGLPCYKRFASMMTQGMKKGLSGLKESLEYEVRESYELRKSRARKMGEEATSRLLVPMAMMLGVVLVIVTVPAFMSLTV